MSRPRIEGFLYKRKQLGKPSKDGGEPGQKLPYHGLLSLKKWQKRWFVLRESGNPKHFVLEYYENQNRKKPKGMFDSNQFLEVKRVHPHAVDRKEFPHMFQLNIRDSDYILLLAAPSESEMNKWLCLLSEVCGPQEDCDDDQDLPSPRISTNQSHSSSIAEPGQKEVASWSRSSATTQIISETGTFPPSKSPSVHSSLDSVALVPVPSINADHPYIFLRNCLSKPRPSLDFLHDSLIRQPSIPEEAAPPPPGGFHLANVSEAEDTTETDAVDSDNLYRSPPSCVVYVKSGNNYRTQIPPSGSMNNRSGTVVSMSMVTYDSPPSRAGALRHSRSKDLVRDHDRLFTESSYDQLPKASLAIFARKHSLPVDTKGINAEMMYDHVPLPTKPAAGSSMTLPHRRSKALEEIRKSDLIHNSPVYDQPPKRTGKAVIEGKLTHDTSTDIPPFYDYPPSRTAFTSSISQKPLSPVQENCLPLAPPLVNRNNKPLVETDGTNSAEDNQKSLIRVESPRLPSSSPTGMSEVVPSAFPFDSRMKKSNSQENLSYRSPSQTHSDLMQRRNTGNSSSIKPLFSTAGVEYTRIDFGGNSGESMSKSKTLPRRLHTQHSAPGSRSSPVEVFGIIGTEYKHIDPIKTKALHITKKEHESTLLRS